MGREDDHSSSLPITRFLNIKMLQEFAEEEKKLPLIN
jgi:hypothetical protein